MKYNNIFCISDNQKAAKELKDKILLSRKNDAVFISDFKNAFKNLSEKTTDIIIIHAEKFSDTDFIKEIKKDEKLKNCYFLLLTDTSNPDILSECFDLGFDDYIDISADETTVCMRVLWSIKNKTKTDILQNRLNAMSLLNITDKNTGFYTEKYTNMIFEQEFAKYSYGYRNAVIMLLSADRDHLEDISVSNLAKYTKRQIRCDDLGGFINDNKLLLLLNQTDKDGAKNVFDKINSSLPLKITVSASACNFSGFENYKEMLKTLNGDLTKALKTGNSLIFSGESKTFSPVFEKIAPDFKYSLIKEIKATFEKIATPSFFKMQSVYEPLLFGCDFKQTFGEKECSFLIQNENLKYSVTFKYTSFKEIAAEIKENCNQNVSCDNIFLSFDETLAEQIENIIQSGAEKIRTELYKRDL